MLATANNNEDDHHVPSVFDRLARRPARRVTTRLAERFGNGFCDRLRRRLADRFSSSSSCHRRRRWRRRDGDGDDDAAMTSTSEKRADRKPKHWLHVFTTTNRIWQWLSSMLAYAIFAYLALSDEDGRRLEQTQAKAIEGFAVGMILYHTSVLLLSCLLRRSRGSRTWRFVSLATVVGDFLMMGLSISKMNVLSATGVLAGCHGQEQAGFFKTIVKNGKAFANSRFGWGAANADPDEMDAFCCLPKIVYLLCGVAVFSYTFSILFTGLQLQRQKNSKLPATHPGFIEEAIPERMQQQVQLAFVPRSSFAAPRPSVSVEPVSETVQPAQMFYPQRNSASEDLPRYPTLADEPFSVPRGRSSQETTSSFDPDLYLISDGFRPSPEYSSRPPSFRSRPPSYSSRPSSIRNI